MPSKWMVGGKVILKSFRKEMMEDLHIEKMYDYENDREIFPTSHNDGGICYFLWNSSHNGNVDYCFKSLQGELVQTNRKLKIESNDIVIRDLRRYSIISKMNRSKSLKEIVSLTQPFGIRKDLFNTPENYTDSNLNTEHFENSVRIYGVKGIKGGARRTSGYILKTSVKKNVEWINKYKIFFTTSYSTNALNPPAPILGAPNDICTETFLVIGPFDKKEEQVYCLKYIDTKCFKFLLYCGRGTMQVSQDVFRFVPLQDFTSQSDIDWSVSIPEIDEQLYQKYGLSDDEIAFIEKMIKPM